MSATGPPDSAPDERALAARFAAVLDGDDFAGLEPMLAASCAYDTGRGTLRGPAAILASYREASERARKLFDAVRYDSEVVEVGEGFAVLLFRDHLELQGETHVHRCHQRVTFAGGAVVRIEQRDLPGERERVRAFCGRLGVELGS